MDAIDKQLLHILAADSSTTATDISAQIHLSIPAINKRITKLRTSGVIQTFTVQVDPRRIGKSVQAFILLVVSEYAQTKELFDFVNSQKDVIDCYAITGEYDYLIKICTKDIDSLEDILLKLKEKRCVSKSHTMFALMEHKHVSGPLPD